ncbi:MAG: DUF2344 domain-containing protein [Planctomycetes bacterium]|nr:DUF2344 domain-containing protein [Planctomycetota bacterium]
MTAARPDHPVTLIVRKGGELAWLGHLDLARAIERALRRAEFPLRFTEGFHRRIRMRLPEPLPLGVGSDAERYVVRFGSPVAPAAVIARLEGRLPVGLQVLAAWAGEHPEALDAALRLACDAESAEALAAALAALPPAIPGWSGSWRALDPVVPAADGGGQVVLELTAPAGTRVSVGRFLEALRQAHPAGLALRSVTRRVAWQSQDPSLASPAPFLPAPPGNEGAGSTGPASTPP